MTISDLRLDPLPGGFRASARIESEEGGPNGELWFETSGGVREPAPEVAAGAFLAACLPTAVWRGEDLRIEAPVDAEILWRAPRQAQALARLHRRPRRIGIVGVPASSPPREGKIVGASFSGGVDSFHALMSNRGPDGPHPIAALVTGFGFDTRADDLEAHAEVLRKLGVVSDELGLRHLSVRTNFQTFFRPYADWNRVTHGASLIAFAFLLSGELSTYLMPGSLAIDRSYRWGTHPLLDGGWECGHLRVVVDGWHVRRNDKLAEIAAWPLATRNLRVCARGRGMENCGRCEKCLLTMSLLTLEGVATDSFPHPLTGDLIRRVKIREARGLYGWEGIRQRAREKPELAWLADAIGHVARMTRFHAPRRRLETWIKRGKGALDPIDA